MDMLLLFLVCLSSFLEYGFTSNSTLLMKLKENETEKRRPGEPRVAEVLYDVSRDIGTLRAQLTALKRQSHLIYLLLKSKQHCRSGKDGPAITNKCPSGFEFSRSRTSSCYRVDTDQVSWSEARARCENLGAELVAIETRSEQRFIVDHIKKTPSYQHCDLWTGGTDRHMEGRWVWLGSYKPITYNAWQHNEPNNGAHDENCLLMDWFFGWRWNDARCEATRACFICEYKTR